VKFARVFLFFAVFASASTPLAAQDAKLASLFIVSFSKYVEWPAGNDPTCTITVLGDDPIYDQLKPLAAVGQIEGRTIVVNKAARLENIAKTSILYISPEKSNQLGTAAAKFGPDHTLIDSKARIGQRGRRHQYHDDRREAVVRNQYRKSEKGRVGRQGGAS
jgi:hypothetical protein